MIDFTYFDNAENLASFLDAPVNCDLCKEEKICLDASLFYGEETLTAVCPECLKNGALKSTTNFTCEGDREDLLRQMEMYHPKQSNAEHHAKIDELTTELEKTTPPIIRWQDWVWPCSDGDYCRFLGYGAKAFYNRLAKDGDGEYLFKDSFYHTVKEDADGDYFWEEVLPAKEIKNHTGSEKYDTLFYVFKSRHSERIFTIYDAA